jgi:uncharacterized membrane protein YesL
MNQAVAALRVLRRSFSDEWNQMAVFLVVNLLWLLGTVTIVLAPPALFGMFYVANEAAHKRGVEIRDFFGGARQYFGKSWTWGVVNLIVAVLFWANFTFYPRFAGQLTTPLLVITVALLVVWLSVQLYTIPYLMELETPLVRLALRNGLFTALASPLLTLCLGVAVGLIVLLCLIQPTFAVFGLGTFIGLISNHAVLERLETFGIRTPKAAEASDDPLLQDESPHEGRKAASRRGRDTS